MGTGRYGFWGCLGLLVILAAPASAAEAPRRFGCDGPVLRTDDEAALAARFGRANVAAADLDGAEGATERGTAIFPKDPRRRIEVFWHDSRRRRRPATVRVQGRGGWAATTPHGPVSVGTPLARVEAANGGPFTLIGFGWDLGGYGAGWRGGDLGRLGGGCTLSMRFDPDPAAKPAALDKASGDRRFSSRDPAVRAVSPTVSQMAVDWPE